MRVLITGGTGSFGSGYTAWCKREGYDPPILLSRDEYKVGKSRAYFEGYVERYILADVADYGALAREIPTANPDVIIHAAALKQVPGGEESPNAFVRSNITGTQNILDIGARAGIPVIFVSSDKAVYPTTLYGITKAVGERLALASSGSTAVVRLPNMFGSRGSVLQKILQLQPGDKFYLTDDNMTRFFVPIPQAVEFVDAVSGQLLSIAGGTSQPNAIYPLLAGAIHIAGLIQYIAPDAVVEIQGKRVPSEKIHETLIAPWEDIALLAPDPLYHPGELHSSAYQELIPEKTIKSWVEEWRALQEPLEENIYG